MHFFLTQIVIYLVTVDHCGIYISIVATREQNETVLTFA